MSAPTPSDQPTEAAQSEPELQSLQFDSLCTPPVVVDSAIWDPASAESSSVVMPAGYEVAQDEVSTGDAPELSADLAEQLIAPPQIIAADAPIDGQKRSGSPSPLLGERGSEGEGMSPAQAPVAAPAKLTVKTPSPTPANPSASDPLSPQRAEGEPRTRIQLNHRSKRSRRRPSTPTPSPPCR